MSSLPSAVSLPRLAHWSNKPTWEKALDLIIGCGWIVYATLYLNNALHGQGWANWGLFLFYTLVAFLFIFRRPARKTAPWWQTLVAFADAIWPVLWLRATNSGWFGGHILQGLAMALMIAATFSLGLSFGIAPADRGLRTRGVYRWIRHPLYAGELLFYVGYCLVHPSWHNVIGGLISFIWGRLRIKWEEAILHGYEAYAQQVPWRLLPFIW